MMKKSAHRQTSQPLGKLLHRSKLTLEYFISVDDVKIDDIPRKVLKAVLVSDMIPDKPAAEFSALLPNFSDEEVMDKFVEMEVGWIDVFCGGIETLQHAIKFLNYGCKNIDSRTYMLDQISKGGDPVKCKRERNFINKSIAKMASEDFRRDLEKILEVHNVRRSDYSFPILSKVHELIKPVWQAAHEIARSAQRSRLPQRREGWRSEVEAYFEKQGWNSVDADLITRLGPPAAWPDDLAATLEKHGADTKPYDIALEHAARRCAYPGYLPYSLTIRQLKTHLKMSKQEMEAMRIRQAVRELKKEMSEEGFWENFTRKQENPTSE